MLGSYDTFADRTEAGRRLAAALTPLGLRDPVIYALPRGGVPIGYEIARALHAPLELVLVRKIGAPGAPELALGAVVDGAQPQLLVNEQVRSASGADDAYLARAREAALTELERRRTAYLDGRTPLSAEGRTAVVVDDGLATGATMRIAIRALRAQHPAQLVVAVPVAPHETLDRLRGEADELVCLITPDRFPGVGAFYSDFHQMSDAEVTTLLRRAQAEAERTDR